MRSAAQPLHHRAGACPARIIVVVPSSLTPAELGRLAELTLCNDDSDLNRLLRDIRVGKFEDVRIALAHLGARIVGWAATDIYLNHVFLNCYVDEDHREQGIATALVQALIPSYLELYKHQPNVDVRARDFFMRTAPVLFDLPKAKRTR